MNNPESESDLVEAALLKYRCYRSPMVVGPLPPPLGGISVYLERLRQNNEWLNIRAFYGGGILSYLGLLRDILLARPDVLHINILSPYLAVMSLICKKLIGFELLYTDHNGQLGANGSALSNWFYGLFLEECRAIYVVNDHVMRCLLKRFTAIREEKIAVQNAFLPPDKSRYSEVRATYPPAYREFLSAHESVFVTGGFSAES